MKLSFLILALAGALITGFSRALRREECHNAMADSPHPTGNVQLVAEVSPATTGLLVRKGVAANSFLLCGLTDEPLGPCTDTPAIGDMANVRHLGAATGTVVMRAAAAIAAQARVFTAANGQVSTTGGTGRYLVGRSVTAATAAGQEIEVVPCFPVIQP